MHGRGVERLPELSKRRTRDGRVLLQSLGPSGVLVRYWTVLARNVSLPRPEQRELVLPLLLHDRAAAARIGMRRVSGRLLRVCVADLRVRTAGQMELRVSPRRARRRLRLHGVRRDELRVLCEQLQMRFGVENLAVSRLPLSVAPAWERLHRLPDLLLLPDWLM